MLKTLLDVFLKLLLWVSNRPLIVVRIIENDHRLEIGGLQFEIENQSKSPVSLQPHIKSTYWHLFNGGYIKSSTIYDVRDLDRTLPPFTPKLLSASRRHEQKDIIAPWFLTFKFTPSRGPSTVVRIRNSLLEPMNLWQYLKEIIKFRTKGKVTDTGPLNSRDYDIKKHSQGPH